MATQYELTVDMENLTKGTEVEIPGLGVFKNGTSTVLEDDQVAAFRHYNRTYTSETDEETGLTTVTVDDIGPTPLQADWPNGVTVETVKSEPKKPDTPAQPTPAVPAATPVQVAKPVEGGDK